MNDDVRELTEGRLRRVRRQLVEPNRWAPRVPLAVRRWDVPPEPDGLVGEPVGVATALAGEFRPSSPGDPWGAPWSTTWFRLSGRVPDDWAGRTVEAVLDLGFGRVGPGFVAEGLLWAPGPGGEHLPDRGLHPANHTVRLFDRVAGGESVDLLVEAAANPLFLDGVADPNSDRLTSGTAPLYRVGSVDLAVLNPEVDALHHDVRALAGLLRELPAGTTRTAEIVVALGRMLDVLDPLDVVGSAGSARAELAVVLGRPAVQSAHRITAIGHAHIDSAWLWPLRETKRKCARTFSNVLRLIESDPDVRFACSQAAQYEWMRDLYPSVFEGIRAAVAAGSWVPVGGNWVEADGNVTGGESIVRQFVHGQRFFREHFGVTCTEQWIPDVFGYPASFPQIFRLAGADRFVTQKMSWNQTNPFPHHTFWWEGIDGSRVYTHFPPVDTYNASIEPFELAKVERNYNEKGVGSRSLMPFGFGDGGGGPNREMMERYRRLRDIEGLPRIEIGSPEQFFDAATAELPEPAVWVGELYLEAHRGTYTSQARTKQGNRRCERLLREAELWSLAAFGGTEAAGYPLAQLDRIWKTVLLHQFHDILPGSSIGWVHREAEATYAALAEELEGLIAAALEELAPGGPTLFNPAPHDRDEVVVLHADEGVPPGTPDTQHLADGGVAFRARVPASGSTLLTPVPVAAPVTVVEGRVMDNGVLRVAVADDGTVSSLTHVPSGRELLAPGGRGALLQLHHDLPVNYDAWDIDEYYRNRVEDLDGPCEVEVLEAGPLLARIRVSRTFRSSTVTQTFELRAGAETLDVDVALDWRERDHLLKLAWPLDIHAADVVRNIQYGHLRTPIHTNTSWDRARFEICAHQWLDVGEPGFGVALLGDSRYGYDVTRTRSGDRPSTTMRITVVKGSQHPDPGADLGQHRFRYCVMPHAGHLRRAGVITAGYHLNLPVRVATGRAGAPAPPYVAVDHPGVVVEAVKAAEDGSGDHVVRLYEAFGGRASAVLTFGEPFRSVRLVDLLEDERPDLPSAGLETVDDRRVTLTLRPFQIVTLRLSI